MRKIRESHMRLDGFGIEKLFPAGHVETVFNRGTGKPWRGNMRNAEQEAKRLNMLEGYAATATGCTFRAYPIARDSALVQKPLLTYGCGF